MEKISSYSKEYHKRYCEEHKAERQAYMKNYYKTHQKIRDKQTSDLKKRNREKYGPAQAWIKPARIERRLGRKKLAKRMGVSAGTIYQWEVGSLRAPTERIKEALGIE